MLDPHPEKEKGPGEGSVTQAALADRTATAAGSRPLSCQNSSAKARPPVHGEGTGARSRKNTDAGSPGATGKPGRLPHERVVLGKTVKTQ